jgi:hypothetical protein
MENHFTTEAQRHRENLENGKKLGAGSQAIPIKDRVYLLALLFLVTQCLGGQ